MTEPKVAPRPQRWRTVLAGALLGLVLAGLGEMLYALVGSNLRTVVPGEFYRCAQPGREEVRALKEQGVRTIVSLRGLTEEATWAQEEFQAAEEHGLSLEVLAFSAGRYPSPLTLRRLVEIFDHAELPLAVHCQRGVDRSGLAAAIYLLLHSDVSLETARGQLSLRYFHLSAGRTGAMLRFLDGYTDWLTEQGETHRPERFRQWLLHEYRAPQGSARLELVGGQPTEGLRLARDTARTLTLRVWNEASTDLRLTRGLSGGRHLRWTLRDATRQTTLQDQPAGLREATIRPGESTDIGLYLPPLPTPGRYWLEVSLYEIPSGSAALFGSEPLLVEVEVR